MSRHGSSYRVTKGFTLHEMNNESDETIADS